MKFEPLWPKVRDCVLASGLKQEYIANKIGIKPAKLSLILNGKRRLTADELRDICYAIDISPNVLFDTPTHSA